MNRLSASSISSSRDMKSLRARITATEISSLDVKFFRR